MLNEGDSQTRSAASQMPGLTESFLKDLAVRLSLASYSLEKSLQILKGHQTAGLDLLAEEHAREAGMLAEEVTALKARIQAAEEEVRDRRALATTQADLARDTLNLQERRVKLETQIRQKRRQRQASAIEQEAGRRADRARAEVLDRLSTQVEIGQKIFDIEEKCWKINQPENERRKKLLEEELVRLDADLAECRKRVDKLKNGGITKTVAGFLVWAGYLGFAATGTAISYLLLDRFPRKEKDPWIALSGVTEFLRQLRTDYGSLVALVAPLVFLLCLLALFVGCIWLTDILLRRFDRRWRTGRLPRKARNKNGAESNSPLSPVAQILKLPDIGRASFVQLLASVPYIFGAGAVFLLLSVAGASLKMPSQTDPAAALVPSYIGAVYALLATSAFMLYVLYILLPRVDRLAERNSLPTLRGLLTMHWELAMLLVCLLVALAVVAFAPQGRIYTQACWGCLAIAMTMSGMGLAHGLIYHGQFRDVDRAERLRGEVKALADSLSLGPTIELGGLYDSERIRENLDAAREEADDFELVRSLHSTVLSYAEDPVQWSGFLGMWLDMIGGKSKRDRKRFKDELKQLAMAAAPAVDFESAPQESQEVYEIDLKILDHQAQTKRLEQELADVKVAENAMQQERENLQDAARREREAQAAFSTARASMAVQQAREEMVFRAAFGVGERVATLMALPQVLPPSGGAEGDPTPSDLPTM